MDIPNEILEDLWHSLFNIMANEYTSFENRLLNGTDQSLSIVDKDRLIALCDESNPSIYTDDELKEVDDLLDKACKVSDHSYAIAWRMTQKLNQFVIERTKESRIQSLLKG